MTKSSMNKGLAAALLALATFGTAQAADVCTGRPVGIGPGMSVACSRYVAMKADERAVTDAWILGAISGANLYAPKFNAVGAGKPPAQTLQEIGYVCRIMPDKAVADAVATYLREMTRDCTGNPPAPSASNPDAPPRIERRA